MPQMTADAVRVLAAQVGFTGTGLDMAVAIAGAESGFNSDAVNVAGNTPPSRDRGLWQINSFWHSEITDACAFDPTCAAHAALVISKNGTDWSPWTTFGNGAYKKFLPTQGASAVTRKVLPFFISDQENPVTGPGFHLPVPVDGMPDENADYNCGETDVADVLYVLFGLRINPDDMKDWLFGQGATFRPSAIPDYQRYFDAHDPKIPVSVQAKNFDMTSLRAEVDAGHYTILLIPSSSWTEGANPPPKGVGPFHFVVLKGYDTAAHTLVCDNPFHAFTMERSEAFWTARIQGAWALVKTGELMAVRDNYTFVTNDPDFGTCWKDKRNGKRIGTGAMAMAEAVNELRPVYLEEHLVAGSKAGGSKGMQAFAWGDGNTGNRLGLWDNDHDGGTWNYPASALAHTEEELVAAGAHLGAGSYTPPPKAAPPAPTVDVAGVKTDIAAASFNLADAVKKLGG